MTRTYWAVGFPLTMTIVYERLRGNPVSLLGSDRLFLPSLGDSNLISLANQNQSLQSVQ